MKQSKNILERAYPAPFLSFPFVFAVVDRLVQARLARQHADDSLYVHHDDLPASGGAGLADTPRFTAGSCHHHRYANHLIYANGIL